MTSTEFDAVVRSAADSLTAGWELAEGIALTALRETAVELGVEVADLAALVVADGSRHRRGRTSVPRPVDAPASPATAGPVSGVFTGSRRDCRMLFHIALARGVTASWHNGCVWISHGYDEARTESRHAAVRAIQGLRDLATSSGMQAVRVSGV